MKTAACFVTLFALACGGTDHAPFVDGQQPTETAGEGGQVDVGGNPSAGSLSSGGSNVGEPTAGEGGSENVPVKGGSGGTGGKPTMGGQGGQHLAGAGGMPMAGTSSGGSGGSMNAAGSAGTLITDEGGAGGVPVIEPDTCSSDDRLGDFIVQFKFEQLDPNNTCETAPSYDPASFPSVVSAFTTAYKGGITQNGGCNFVGNKATDDACVAGFSYKCCYAPTGGCFDAGAQLTIDVSSTESKVDGSEFTGTIRVQDGCVGVFSFVAKRN